MLNLKLRFGKYFNYLGQRQFCFCSEHKCRRFDFMNFEKESQFQFGLRLKSYKSNEIKMFRSHQLTLLRVISLISWVRITNFLECQILCM